MSHFLDYDPDDIDVRVTELLTASSDSADPLVHPKVGEALGLLRRHLGMDVIFVSQFQDRRRTFRVVDALPGLTRVAAGQSDPLEESWCQFVVDGRVPELIEDASALVKAGKLPDARADIGTHLSTPIVLQNGVVYGTLCCYSQQAKPEVSQVHLGRLKAAAKILGRDLSHTPLGADLELEPLAPARPRTPGGA